MNKWAGTMDGKILKSPTKTVEKELTVELLQALLGRIKIEIMDKLDKMETKFEVLRQDLQKMKIGKHIKNKSWRQL